MVSPNRIQWSAERIVDMPVPKVLEGHVEMTNVSSRNRVQQRLEEQSVGRKRISECGVEQVDVSAGQLEVSQYPPETRVSQSSFGRSFFGMYTDRHTPSTSWKGSGCSLERSQLLVRVESFGWQELGLEAPRRRVFSLCPNVVFLSGGGGFFHQTSARQTSGEQTVQTVQHWWCCSRCNVATTPLSQSTINKIVRVNWVAVHAQGVHTCHGTSMFFFFRNRQEENSPCQFVT